MRLIRTIGFAAVAAFAAMAFIGASSASAGNTLLCELDTPSLTPSAAECATPSELHFLTVEEVANPTKDGKGTLLNSSLNLKCERLFGGKRTSAALADPAAFSAVSSYSNCTSFCVITVLQQGTISILKTAVELGNLTTSGFVIEINCGGFFKCDFDGSSLVGHVLGANVAGTSGKGHVTYSGNKLNLLQDLKGFGGCPAAAFLDGLFQSLKPFYIRS